jgi:hypothetical protein
VCRKGAGFNFHHGEQMFGKIFSTDCLNWAVILTDDRRVHLALPSSASEAVFRSLRRNCRVEFDLVHHRDREVVRNLQRADSVTAAVNMKALA